MSEILRRTPAVIAGDRISGRVDMGGGMEIVGHMLPRDLLDEVIAGQAGAQTGAAFGRQAGLPTVTERCPK